MEEAIGIGRRRGGPPPGEPAAPAPPPHPVLLCPVDYQILCGNQVPGFVIDIHTGKPLGE